MPPALVCKQAVVHGAPNDHADLVHVGAGHHAAAFPLLVGVQVAHGVNPNFIGIFLCDIADIAAHAAFVARYAVEVAECL